MNSIMQEILKISYGFFLDLYLKLYGSLSAERCETIYSKNP